VKKTNNNHSPVK